MRPLKIGDEVEAQNALMHSHREDCTKKRLGVVTEIGQGLIRVHYMKIGFGTYEIENVRLLTCEETGGPNHSDPIEYANHFIERTNKKSGYQLNLHKVENTDW